MDGNGDRAWFAPKRYGYGTALPVAWQGWALIVGYVALVALVATAMEQQRAMALVLILPATVWLIVVAARKTRGGWRWRWGE